MKLALRVIACVVLVVIVAAGVFYFNPLWVADQQIRLRLWHEGVQSHYLNVDGYRLHYFEALPPGGSVGKPLVLVHGLGARGEDWGAMIPLLAAQGFHVYVPDLLGYGRSARPDVSYSISMQELVVIEFMRAVHLSRADIGGWSMGGWIVMKLALDHPDLVNRLMIYDSAGVYFSATFEPSLFTPEDTAGVRKLIKILSPKPMNMPEFAARAAVRKLQANAWVLSRSTKSMMDGRDLLDFRLHDMKPPMLIVWGAQDELIPLVSGEIIHKYVQHSVLNVIEGCGHLAPAECSKPVTEATVAFLKAEPPMSGGEKTFPAQ